VLPSSVLGLLRAGDQFDPADVERVRLIQLLERRGNDLATIARCHADQPDLLDRFITMLFPDGQYPNLSLPEAARRAGVDHELAQRLWTAAGMAGPGELLTSDDVDAIRLLAVAADAGFPEDALLQMVRVYSDSLSRVAEAEARLFHICVHERLRDEGLTGEALVASTNRASDQLLGMVEPPVLYFHRKGMPRAMRDDLVLHLAEEAGLVPPDDRTGRLLAAVLFVDLARFTSLTEAMSDATATDVLNRFSELVRRSVTGCGGRVVKQIGDAFMLVFTNAPSALTCALDIRAAANAEPQFLGTRQGLHWGPVLYREGDCYGGIVNVAARIVAEAAADQLLVSAELRMAAGNADGVTFTPIGPRQMKHVTGPVELFEARTTTTEENPPRDVDPVCGMVLDAKETTARLTWESTDHAFCSTECLRRFVSTPHLYA